MAFLVGPSCGVEGADRKKSYADSENITPSKPSGLLVEPSCNAEGADSTLVGLTKTIYIRCIYSTSGREIVRTTYFTRNLPY